MIITRSGFFFYQKRFSEINSIINNQLADAVVFDLGLSSIQLNNLENTEKYTGRISRINGNVDTATQTISVYIEIKNSSLKEGMYLEAKLTAKNEPNAIEVNRSLLLDENKIFIVRDNVLDVIEVTPTYFSETKVVLKNIPDNTIILSNPFPGAFVGMSVNPLQREKENISKIK